MIFDKLIQLKQQTSMVSIIMMAIGFTLMIWPEQYTEWLVTALGYVLLVVATLMVLEFIASKKQ